MAAKKNGDIETVQAIIDEWCSSNICHSTIFFEVVESNDMELLSFLALKVKSLSEWNLCHNEFEPLLNAPEFPEVKKHYADLKKTYEDEKRETERLKRQENEKKKHDAFLRNPKNELIKAVGQPSEKKLWREWYDYQFSLAPASIIFHVTHELSDLDWASFFPMEYLEKVVLESSRFYAPEYRLAVEAAVRDLHAFLQPLYEQREEMRDEIISINGRVYLSGRGASAVNFGDHHEDWFVSFDSIPAYKLNVFLDNSRVRVSLEEIQ